MQNMQSYAPNPFVGPSTGNGNESISAPMPSSHSPLVTTGDWTKDLVHLAKTAELKKHALTLQLHTAHILSTHASLEQKSKAIQDIKEQKNKLESERARLLDCLRQVNEDRDKADMMETQMMTECSDLRGKITHLTDKDYAVAKADVDRLRQELGQPPLPSLQTMLDEKSAQYLTDRRLNGETTSNIFPVSVSAPSSPRKRTSTAVKGDDGSVGKRPRGRPKGSKNRSKAGGTEAGASGIDNGSVSATS